MKLVELNHNDLLSLLLSINKEPLKYRNKLNIRNNIYFGNEIEVDNIEATDGYEIVDRINDRYLSGEKNQLYVSNENTCDCEIVTPPLNNTEYNWRLLKYIYETISSYGARIHYNTSSHIHISSDLINTKQKLTTFLKIIFTFEDIIFKYSYGYQNAPRKYITAIQKPIYAALLLPDDIKRYIKALDDNDLKLGAHLVHMKTAHRLNYVNFKYFNIDKILYNKDKNDHIEFRSFNGTLYPEITQNNINLVASIIQTIDDNTINIDLLNHLYNIELEKKEKYNGIIKDVAIDLHNEYNDDYNDLLNSYSIPNIKKATIFADMFFKEEIDKYYFLKQYLKLFNKNEESIKKITM